MSLEKKITDIILKEIAIDSVLDYLLKDDKYMHFATQDIALGYRLARDELRAKVQQIIGR